MVRWVLIHLPHLLPPVVAFGFLIRLGIWAADQPPQQFDDAEVAAWRAERDALKAERHRPVLLSAARTGTLALGPLAAAFGTGLAIYTFNLRGDRPSGVLIWSHTALSVAALVLVSVKAARIGWPRIRRTLALKRPQQAFSSLVLLALGVPLTLTGAVQFGSPDGTGLFDYVHLIASVWWTVLLQWHLWRYLGRAVSLALAGARAPVDSPSP